MGNEIDLTMLARSAYRAILRSMESEDEAPEAPEDKEDTRGS